MRVETFAMKHGKMIVKWPKTIVTENLHESVKTHLLKNHCILVGTFPCSIPTILLSNQDGNAKEEQLMALSML